MKIMPRFFCVVRFGGNDPRPDWRSMLRHYKGIRLIAKDRDFGGRDFQAHQAVIRIEE